MLKTKFPTKHLIVNACYLLTIWHIKAVINVLGPFFGENSSVKSSNIFFREKSFASCDQWWKRRAFAYLVFVIGGETSEWTPKLYFWWEKLNILVETSLKLQDAQAEKL